MYGRLAKVDAIATALTAEQIEAMSEGVALEKIADIVKSEIKKNIKDNRRREKSWTKKPKHKRWL